MKHKSLSKKLVLSKVSISNLSETELLRVKGGNHTDYLDCWTLYRDLCRTEAPFYCPSYYPGCSGYCQSVNSDGEQVINLLLPAPCYSLEMSSPLFYLSPYLKQHHRGLYKDLLRQRTPSSLRLLRSRCLKLFFGSGFPGLGERKKRKQGSEEERKGNRMLNDE